MEVLQKPPIEKNKVKTATNFIQLEKDWRTPIFKYLMCNTLRAQTRVVHIKDMEERKQHQLNTFWAEYRQRTRMLSVLDLGKPRDG